jgi:hypothetical protein
MYSIDSTYKNLFNPANIFCLDLSFVFKREKEIAQNIIKITSSCKKVRSRFLFMFFYNTSYHMDYSMISTDIKQIIYIFFGREIINNCQLEGRLKPHPQLSLERCPFPKSPWKGAVEGGDYYSNNKNNINNNNKYKKVCRFFITKYRG